jgi:hypothetical protein
VGSGTGAVGIDIGCMPMFMDAGWGAEVIVPGPAGIVGRGGGADLSSIGGGTIEGPIPGPMAASSILS